MNTTFEAVYQAQYEKLYTLAFRMTGSKEDAEDVLQTAFLNAYKAFDRFRHDSAVSTWLYRIVMNVAKKYAQESRKLPVEEYAEEHQISQADVYNYINRFGQVEDEVLTNRTRETCLQMFMNCMPSKYRAVYTLRIILDFSVQETAEILDIKENTVKVNLYRARNIIKTHFAGRCSLIQPGALCDCRSYAKFLFETKRIRLLLDIETVRNKEQAATEEFRSEMREILQIEKLYNTRIIPLDYAEFLTRIKKIRKEKRLKILEYD
jgi:RNA polymerase sigma factor (sigma-70 family)